MITLRSSVIYRSFIVDGVILMWSAVGCRSLRITICLLSQYLSCFMSSRDSEDVLRRMEELIHFVWSVIHILLRWINLCFLVQMQPNLVENLCTGWKKKGAEILKHTDGQSWNFFKKQLCNLLFFKAVLGNSSLGFLRDLFTVCLWTNKHWMNHSSIRKAPNSRDEAVLCLHTADNVAKNQFQIVSVGTLLLAAIHETYIRLNFPFSQQTVKKWRVIQAFYIILYEAFNS